MDSRMKKTLRPFRRRLTAEAAAKAACLSGMPVLTAWLAVSLAQRIFAAADARLAGLMIGAWAALFAALFALLRPSRKETARRLDALCGMDRMATAVEFAGNDGVLCRLQREDAAARMEAIGAKALKIHWPVRSAVACTALAALIACVPLIPQEAADGARDYVFDKIPGLAQQESEEAAALRAMMETLREEIENAGLKENDKAALLKRLEETLGRLDKGMMDIAALQEIRTAMDGMQETVRELTPRDTYMAAMIEFESLRLLGEAIFDENMDVVIMILESMGRQLHEKKDMEQVNALMDLVYDINGSLAKPLRDNGQEQLRQGMMMLSGGLETAAEMVYNRRDNTKMIDAALDTAKTHIRDFLGVPEEGERYDPFANRVYAPDPNKKSGGAAAAALIEEETLSPDETEYVYSPPPALRSSGYVPGALGEDGKTQRIKAETRERPTGAVPYGEVYGDYYAQYLAALSAESFPQELRETAESYMNGL